MITLSASLDLSIIVCDICPLIFKIKIFIIILKNYSKYLKNVKKKKSFSFEILQNV